jgi:hypothetical protein
MPYACRIDDLIFPGNGTAEIRYTQGPTPLPATWQGAGITIPSKADAIETAHQIEDVVKNNLPILMLAIAAAVSENFTAAAINKVKGHTLTIDLTLTANVIRLT